VVEALSPHLTDRRKERIEQALRRRIGSVHVAVENPADVHNAIATVRTSEALGVNHLHIVGGGLKKGRGKGVLRGTDRWVHLLRHPSLALFLSSIKGGGRLLAGASPEGERELEALPVDVPLCLIFGNEMRGLSEEALAACDLTYRIPMQGLVESFNISVSCAISLYVHLKERRRLLGREGDLSEEELQSERAYCYLRAIGRGKALKIIERHNA